MVSHTDLLIAMIDILETVLWVIHTIAQSYKWNISLLYECDYKWHILNL